MVWVNRQVIMSIHYNYGCQVLWNYATLRHDFKGEMYLYNGAKSSLIIVCNALYQYWSANVS